MRAGDSLQTIAQAAYGDSQLWYLIADANGLSGNSDLRVGQTVSIPTKVGSIHNTAGTYKPYDPSQVIGSTTPTLPVPQSGGGDDCGGLGLVILIIVAVVVTVLTEGAASEFLIAALGETGGTIAAAAVGAAAGSVASQVVGMAIGVVDEFSWKAVALAALTAGVTKGLPAGNLLGTTAGTIGNSIVRAAVANAMTQGIAVAVGLQDRFDWKGVAASAIGAGVGASVSEGLGITNSAGQRTAAFNNSSMGEQVFKASLTGLAAGTATALARGGRVSVQQIASDAFGNALGSSLGQQINQGGQQEDRLGNFIAEQEAAQTQRDNAAAKTSFRQSEIAYQNDTESAPTSMGGGSGLRLGGGGIGIRLSASAVKDWSDGIDGGIMLNGSMAPAEEPRALRTYTVQPGDNPASIGVKFFGDSRAGATILADNGLDASVRGARNLPVGTVLTLRDDISEGNLRAGGRLIGADTSVRAQETAAVVAAQAKADQTRDDAVRMGAWSGRMNQVGSVGTTTGAASWSAAISDSSLLGATAGVAASFGEMAVGAARIGSNMIMQVGDILTGGYNHDHPVMQQVWSEQRALGAGIVNALTSPVLTTTNLIEGTVNRYDNAMGQSSNFDRSYELGKLFNDVGQGAIGAGSALRGAARLGVSGLEFIGDTAFTGPSSQTAIRANVEANIAATRLGSASSNINIFFAKSDQIASGYQADVWTGTVLKQDSVVYALRPGASAYFTDFDTVQGARLDSYSLSQALQVKPHEIYGYRPDVTGFRVTQDVFVPGGRAIANSAFGAGGGTQFFIENSGKYLEPITTINLKKPL